MIDISTFAQDVSNSSKDFNIPSLFWFKYLLEKDHSNTSSTHRINTILYDLCLYYTFMREDWIACKLKAIIHVWLSYFFCCFELMKIQQFSLRKSFWSEPNSLILEGRLASHSGKGCYWMAKPCSVLVCFVSDELSFSISSHLQNKTHKQGLASIETNLNNLF